MALRLNFAMDSLVRFADRLPAKSSLLKAAAVRSLNRVGAKTVDDMVENLVVTNGISKTAARKLTTVKRATAANSKFEINVKKPLVELDDANRRPLPTQRQFKARPTAFFRSDDLVEILNVEDERLCEICQGLADNGPYTIEEARQLIPAHPNCRCTVRVHRSRATVAGSARRGNARGFSFNTTMGQLSKMLRDETRVILRAK